MLGRQGWIEVVEREREGKEASCEKEKVPPAIQRIRDECDRTSQIDSIDFNFAPIFDGGRSVRRPGHRIAFCGCGFEAASIIIIVVESFAKQQATTSILLKPLLHSERILA